MIVEPTLIPDVKLLRMRRHGDARGFFCETYSRRDLHEAGITSDFVQDNHSLSRPRGVLRGLHFQIPPFEQDKLVRVTRGAILDVAVDLRHGSPTFGRHVAAVIAAAEATQLFVPAGFAHGFCTLEEDTEVLYKVSAYYAPQHERGLAFDDPALAIDWPVAATAAILSDKDRHHPRLAALPRLFRYAATPAAEEPTGLCRALALGGLPRAAAHPSAQPGI
ncbi:MAG: dTDP-4-dehydrorhamnose 3,5-epimerase [Alphaproteobacteria bacterium]|nr:dTDP-4-dehydrorhamnose 3,5-epimerase [Alphaproteobacteria bacterium]